MTDIQEALCDIKRVYNNWERGVEDCLKINSFKTIISMLESAQVQEVEGWRDISSAPKDGSSLLLCVDGGDLGYKTGSQAVFIGYYAQKFSLPANEGCDPEKYPALFEYSEAHGDYYAIQGFYTCTFENQYGDEIAKAVKPTHWKHLDAPPKTADSKES